MTKRPRIPGTIVRPTSDHDLVCVLVGDEDDPVVAVQHSAHRHAPWDSGFTVFTKSAPPSPEHVGDEDVNTFCVHCLKKAHPEAERGLLLARAYEHAWWDDDEGGWLAHDEDGNTVAFDSGDEPIPGQMSVDELLDQGEARP